MVILAFSTSELSRKSPAFKTKKLVTLDIFLQDTKHLSQAIGAQHGYREGPTMLILTSLLGMPCDSKARFTSPTTNAHYIIQAVPSVLTKEKNPILTLLQLFYADG